MVKTAFEAADFSGQGGGGDGSLSVDEIIVYNLEALAGARWLPPPRPRTPPPFRATCYAAPPGDPTSKPPRPAPLSTVASSAAARGVTDSLPPLSTAPRPALRAPPTAGTTTAAAAVCPTLTRGRAARRLE